MTGRSISKLNVIDEKSYVFKNNKLRKRHYKKSFYDYVKISLTVYKSGLEENARENKVEERFPDNENEVCALKMFFKEWRKNWVKLEEECV